MQFIDLKQQFAAIEPSVRRRMDAVLAHGQYIMGPEVEELERELAAFTGSAFAIACSSGTDALLLAMMALGIGPGDEVITTPFSFAATAETILLLGATPVYADIDPRTWNIAPHAIEAAITPRTRAILPVSLYGQCADFARIMPLAGSLGIPVIEDAAQSFGAAQHGARSCNLSTIGCTSFFPSKPLGCYGDGGACFTNDPELALRMRSIRVHGQAERYRHVRLGLNARMDTLQAAILLAKLEAFPRELELRTQAAAHYAQLLAGIIAVPHIAEGNTSVYAQYTISVEDRTGFAALLKANGVPTAVHYPLPLHLQPAFQSADFPAGSLPHAEYAAEHVISLPMHPYLTRDGQQQVANAIKHALSSEQARIIQPEPAELEAKS